MLKNQNILKFFVRQINYDQEHEQEIYTSESESEVNNDLEKMSLQDSFKDKENRNDNLSKPYLEIDLNGDNLGTQSNLITQTYNLSKPLSTIKLVSEFTHNDIHVLNKIVKISFMIVSICTILIILWVLILTSGILSSPKGTLIFIIISFYLEIGSCYFIFELFISDIESIEYENLKIIGDIHNFLKNKKNNYSILKFDDILESKIYNRFSEFMHISK